MGTPERHAAFFRDAATVDRRRVRTEGVSVIVGHITNDPRIKNLDAWYWQLKGFVKDANGKDALSSFNRKQNFEPLSQNGLLIRGHSNFEPSRDKHMGLHFQVYPTKEYIIRASTS